MKAEFIKFLKDHGAYVSFIEGLDEVGPIETFVDECPVEDYITNGIYWATTAPGFDFWSDLNQSWITHLKLIA